MIAHYKQGLALGSDATMDFENMIELFVQNKTNMIELYANRWPELRSSYNIKHGDIIVFIPIFAQLIR